MYKYIYYPYILLGEAVPFVGVPQPGSQGRRELGLLHLQGAVLSWVFFVLKEVESLFCFPSRYVFLVSF